MIVIGLLLVSIVVFLAGLLTPINDLYTMPLSIIIFIAALLLLKKK